LFAIERVLKIFCLHVPDESVQLFPIMFVHNPNTQNTKPKMIRSIMADFANEKSRGIPTPRNDSCVES